MNDLLNDEAKSFKIIRPKNKNGSYKPYVSRAKRQDGMLYLNLSTTTDELFIGLKNLFGDFGPQRFFMRYYFPKRFVYTSPFVIKPKEIVMIDPKTKIQLVNDKIKGFRGVPRNKLVDKRNTILDYTDLLSRIIPTDRQTLVKTKVLEYIQSIWPEIICYILFDNTRHDKSNDIDESDVSTESYEEYNLYSEEEKKYPLETAFQEMSEEDWKELEEMIDSGASTEAFTEKLFSKTKLFALSGPAFGMSKFGFDKYLISIPFNMTKYNLLDIQHLTGKVDFLRDHKIDPDLIYPLSLAKFIYTCYNTLCGNASNNDFANELVKYNVTFHIYARNGTGVCLNLREIKNYLHFTPLRFLQMLIIRLKLLCMVNAGSVTDTDLDKLELESSKKESDIILKSSVDDTDNKLKDFLKDDVKPIMDNDDAISNLVKAKMSGKVDVVEEIYENGHKLDSKDAVDGKSAVTNLLSVINGIKAKKTVTKIVSDDPDEPLIEFDDKDLDEILGETDEQEDNDQPEDSDEPMVEADNVLTEIKNEEDDFDSKYEEVEDEVPEESFDENFEENEEQNVLQDDDIEKNFKKANDKGPKKLVEEVKYEANKGERDKKRIAIIKDKYKSLEINGEKIEKIIGNSANIAIDDAVKVGTKKPRTADPNVTKLNLSSFSKAYVKNNYQSDIINSVRALSVNKDVPLYMTNVNVTDTSDQFTDKLTYSFVLEDEFKKKHNLVFDVPKLDENGYIKIGGNKAYLKKQLIRKPIVKIGPDKVYITTQLNSYQIFRSGFVLNKGSEVVRRLLTQFYVNNPNVKIERGNCENDNNDYLTTLEYDALAKDFFLVNINQDSNYGANVIIYFSQKVIRDKIKQFNINTGFKDNVIPDNILPIAINYTNKTLYSIDITKNSSINSTIINIFSSIFPEQELIEFIKKVKTPKRRIMTKAEIQSFKVPLIAFLNYTFGWDRVKSYFPENEIEFSPTKLKTNKLSIKFYDGYLYYNQCPINGAILLNGLCDIDTENYKYEDLNNQALYINYTYDKYKTRNIVKGWVTLKESMLDFKTLQILEAMNLPTDLLEIFLYCNDLLTDNQCLPESDISNYRIRGNEIISQCLYSVLNDQYNVYKKRSGKRVTMTIPVNSVMTKIYKTDILSFYDSISPVSEIRNSGLTTFKGPGGTKLEQAFTTVKRSFDPSYFGIFGISTPDNANAGIVKELTVNTNIINTLGFVGKTDKSNYNFNDITPIAEAITPFATRVDDPSRIAFISGQNNHVGGLLESSLPCVRTGVEKTIHMQCSEAFVIRAKADCIINEVDDVNKRVFLTYKDGKKEYIDYNDRLMKNSDAFNTATYKCHVRPNMKLKEGDVIVADARFFKVDPFTHDLVYTQTRNALVGIAEGSYTEDDADAITQEFADTIHMDFTERKQICIKSMSTIIDYKKVGDHVNLGDPIFVFDDSGTFEEEQDDTENDIINMLYGEVNMDEMAQMIHQTPKAPCSGTIKDMKVYWSVPVSKMSKTAARFVNAYISKIKKEIVVEEKFTGTVSEKRKWIEPINKNNYTSGEPRINGCVIDPNGSIVIEYFISEENGMNTGDKIALNTSLKTINSYVIPKGQEPYTESGKKLDGIFSFLSICARMISSIWYQFIGTILYMKSKQIAKDFLKEIGEEVPKNQRDVRIA